MEIQVNFKQHRVWLVDGEQAIELRGARLVTIETRRFRPKAMTFDWDFGRVETERYREIEGEPDVGSRAIDAREGRG